jgi:hypothetical protein
MSTRRRHPNAGLALSGPGLGLSIMVFLASQEAPQRSMSLFQPYSTSVLKCKEPVNTEQIL